MKLERALSVLTLLSVVTTAGIIITLIGESAGFFAEISPLRLLEAEWRPFLVPHAFGVAPLLFGTLAVTCIAACVAFPLGLLAAIYLAELGPASARAVLKPMLELLAGVPSVVLGYVALRYFTPTLHLQPFNIVSAGIAVGLMLLPTFATLCDDAIYAVPQGVRESAYALGADQLRTLFAVVLPAARSGLVAAVLLSVSRAVGETMIVAIAAGASPQTVAGFMAQMTLGDVSFGTLEHRTLFMLGLLLFVITCALNITAHRLVRQAVSQ